MTKNKILIIDDEEDIRLTLEELLVRTGYQIQGAGDGIEGLKLLETFKPELVITDLKMPNMSGSEFISKAKNLVPSVDVILMTGYGDKEIVIECLRQGLFDYFDKPFNYQKMVLSVKKCFELRKIKKELSDEKNFTENILNNLHEIVIAIDNQGKISYINSVTINLLGFKAEELIGQSLLLLIPDYDSFNAVAESKESIEQDLLCAVKGGGEKIPMTLIVADFIDNAGLKKGKVLVGRDVRELRKLQLLTYQTEKLASVGTLAAGIAHELNSPLAVVLGYATEIQKIIKESDYNPQKNEDVISYLGMIHKSATRMKVIVSNLLTLSRKSEHTDPHELNINELIKEAFAFHKTSFEEKNIDVGFFLSESLYKSWGDPDQIQTIFMNLLGNSADAFGEITDEREKRVSFTTSNEVLMEEGVAKPVLKIIYEDNACGMSESTVKKLFDPFFTTKSVGKGTGLGMSVTLAAIKAHKGTVSVESELGKGVKFTIHLPAVTE